jgi:hypothetical protein
MIVKARWIVCFLFGFFIVSTIHAETSPYAREAEMKVMEQRLQRLEALVKQQQFVIEQLQGNDKIADTSVSASASALPGTEVAESDGTGLDISGFFDVQASTVNQREQTFELGDLEVDLEYVHDEHYSASMALVWDGEESAEVAVALVDYHLFDDNIPPRGRIFSEPGFHLQLGRFDVPFGADYQYFASVDRPNITAPLTTQRIQDGGFNGDGMRAYGTWKNLDGALFWTNSLYADSGYSVGGRLGIALGHNLFSFHHRDTSRDIELGFSYLQDRDGGGNQRNRVYAADLTLRYEAITLVAEYFEHNHDESSSRETDTGLAERDETGYQLSLLADMQSLLHRPLSLFGRYDRWMPDYDFILDADDDAVQYRVQDISRVTLGLNYRFTDYFQFKLEYYDYLGDDTEEPDFEQSLGVVQVVVNF